MAVASRVATMPDSGFLITPATPRQIEAEKGCPDSFFAARDSNGTSLGYQGEACFNGGTAYFGIALSPSSVPLNFHTTDDKFVVGHELGHMQQAASVGDTAVKYPFFNPDGGAPPRPAACGCDSVVSANRYHCLNSREYSSPAQSEGWTHFFSSKLMNDTTAAANNFSYYKEVQEGAVLKRPPVPVNSKTAVKWRNRNCPLAEYGTEWDWLTFLTNVHTSGTNKLSIAELTDVYQRACGTSGTPCSQGEISWDTTSPQIGTAPRKPLDPAARAKFGLGSPKCSQWDNRSRENGVSNDLTP
jgi:hypothetical protein